MAKIICPNKDYTGVSASVTFVNGVGETNDKYLIEWFRERGYTVIESKQQEPVEAPAHEEITVEEVQTNDITPIEETPQEPVEEVLKPEQPAPKKVIAKTPAKR